MLVNIPDPAVVELAKFAGMDFIRIDWEHKLIDPSQMLNLIRTANLIDLAVQVRVPGISDVTALLDAGADSALIPGVSGVDRAREAINEAKYYPVGRRGITGDSRPVGYGHYDLKDYLARANCECITLGIQIEEREAVEHLDELLALEGIDFIVTGRNDLSQSYGLLGQNTHPDILAAEREIIEKALAAGKQPMILANSPARARELREMGVRCILVTQDTKTLYSGLKSVLEQCKA
jgi:4-hydroxy-2-oxoheptanedioate aldolase